MSSSELFELSRDSLIAVTGDGAQSFLHAQFTSDVAALAPNSSQYSGYCTPKGRLLASFLLWRTEHCFYLQLPSSLREAIQQQLSKFILRAKVKVRDASGEFTRYGVAGAQAEASLMRMFGAVPSAPNDVVHHDAGALIRLPVDRFEVVVPREQSPAVLETLAKDARAAGQEQWDWLDIRAGIPVITPATQEEFVPQMVNLDLIGGVSFTKGCYPGQEIVARMHYRGRLKQRMYLAHIGSEAAPQPGDKLYSADLGEQSSGMIVNAAIAPGGGYDALAVIQMGSAESGRVHWKALDGPALDFLPQPYPF
jgi:folate-binding protein YgfZ